MIELPYGLTKFKSTSLKLYFIHNQEPIPDSLAFIQIFPAKAPSAERTLAIIPIKNTSSRYTLNRTRNKITFSNFSFSSSN